MGIYKDLILKELIDLKEDKWLFYDTIREFNRLTGCPMIVNTSYNVRGEPIVCTP